MKTNTAIFGELEYEEKDLIRFEEGLYGFDVMRNFILIPNPEEELPFFYLQSIEDENLLFVITDPFLFIDTYDFELSDKITEDLDIVSIEDVSIVNLVVIHEKVEETTINLKSPLIINRSTRKAKQVILNEDYNYRHILFKNGSAS